MEGQYRTNAPAMSLYDMSCSYMMRANPSHENQERVI